MKREGNYSYDKPWLHRPHTKCANETCNMTVIGKSEYDTLTFEQCLERGVRAHGGFGLCYPCYCRFKRNGTVDYRPPVKRARKLAEPEPCKGTCGRKVWPSVAYRKLSVAERRERGLVAHAARGLCHKCLRAAKANDTYDDLEPRFRTNDEVLAEWDLLRLQGVHDLKIAAERIGISYSALDKAIWRGRQKGDPRAVRPHPNLRSAA